MKEGEFVLLVLFNHYGKLQIYEGRKNIPCYQNCIKQNHGGPEQLLVGLGVLPVDPDPL